MLHRRGRDIKGEVMGRSGVRAKTHRCRERGFTLTELMIATAVFGVLMSIVISIHLAAERQQEQGFRVVEANQHGRTSLDLIARDLRMAGSGLGRIPVHASFMGTPLPPRYPVVPMPAAAGSDSVEIIGGQRGVMTRLAVAMVGETDDIVVDDATGFQVGDMVVVAGLTQAHLFQVTAINANTLVHAGPSPWNSGGADSWPGPGYPLDTRVSQVDYVRYYVDSSDPAHPILMRWQAGADSVFVARDVEMLEFIYTEGDTTLANPGNPLNIREVAISATTVAGSVLNPYNLRRQLATNAAPRIFQ